MTAHVLAWPGAQAELPMLRGAGVWKLYFRFLRDPLGALMDCERQYGRLTMLRDPFARDRHGFILSGADFNRQVLGDPETFHAGGLTIDAPRGSVLNRLRRGLIGANGEAHREIRRVVSPLFQPKSVQQYLPRMVEVVRRELDQWPAGVIDIDEQVSRISLLISAGNLMTGEDPGTALRLAEMSAEVLKQSFALSVRLFKRDWPGTPFRRLVRHAEQLERMLLEVIDSPQVRSDDSSSLLDRLICFHRASPNQLKREDLIGQIFILFAASHETVAKAVSWSLFLLTQHPDVHADLHDELRTSCGAHPPTMSQLEQLPLLNAVTQEAMRLMPPVPFSRRVAQADAELAGRRVRPNDFVFLNHFATHRDPAVFSDPHCFKPQRWFGAPVDRYAYLPFSAGPRTCIGKVLGTVTTNLILAMVVQRFRLTMAPHSRIDRGYQVTLAPKGGLPMTVAQQDGRFTAVPVGGNVREMVSLPQAA